MFGIAVAIETLRCECVRSAVKENESPAPERQEISQHDDEDDDDDGSG